MSHLLGIDVDGTFADLLAMDDGTDRSHANGVLGRCPPQPLGGEMEWT